MYCFVKQISGESDTMEKFGFDYITIEVDETRAIYPIGR